MPFPSVQTIEINGKRLDTGFAARVTESLLVAIDLTLALAPALAGLGRERDRAMERERTVPPQPPRDFAKSEKSSTLCSCAPFSVVILAGSPVLLDNPHDWAGGGHHQRQCHKSS